MKKAIVLLAVFLTACGSEATPVAESTWQITNVYVDDQHPSLLPDSIAGKATLVFGESTLAGFSGCAPFRARVKFTKDDKPATTADAAQLHISNLTIDEPASCEGSERFYHDELTGMLDGNFDIKHESDNELLFVKQTEDFDRPAIRVSSVATQ